MATVYLARLPGVAGFQRLYAVKRLHPHLANEAEFVDMFLDEARLAARIHHPNVVSILEVGMSERGYYLVMEYIEGDTAARLLARASQTGAALPIGATVRIALDTLNGLHAAHELTDDEGRPLQIVHRDVSPQNILIGVDGVSRITDFGVAHAATRLSSTRTGQLKGKLAYMAPEQTRGAAVDRRSDVFAMGVVLWEMLSGKRLFRASNDAETLHRILYAPMPTLRGAGVDIPVPLDAVCMKALARDPDERYSSAADFADELERVARSLGVLGTTREIASYIDGTLGAEISQQREVVRVWLSRSEPSKSERLSMRGLPNSSNHIHLRPESSLRERPSGRDVTMTAHSSAAANPAVSGGTVSSVSSAVLELPEATTSDASHRFAVPGAPEVAAPPSRRSRRKALALVGLSSGAIAAVALLLVWFRGGPGSNVVTRNTTATAASTIPRGVTAPVTSSVPAIPSAEASASPPATPSSLAAVPSASTAVRPWTARTPSGASGSQGTHGGSVAPGVRPKGPGHPAEDPSDDLSRNPYR